MKSTLSCVTINTFHSDCFTELNIRSFYLYIKQANLGSFHPTPLLLIRFYIHLHNNKLVKYNFAFLCKADKKETITVSLLFTL